MCRVELAVTRTDDATFRAMNAVRLNYLFDRLAFRWFEIFTQNAMVSRVFVCTDA